MTAVGGAGSAMAGANEAVRIHEPTGISGLVCEEAPDATPMFCDVLVRVAACGITHTELDWPVWTCRAGHQRTSIIQGHEFSGVVAALGYGTAGIAVGDEVFGDEVFGLIGAYRDGAAAEVIGTGRGHSRSLVRSWAPTASSRWTPTASRTRPGRPAWYWTRSAARCSPARPPGRRGAPSPPGRRGVPARGSGQGLQRRPPAASPAGSSSSPDRGHPDKQAHSE